MEFLCRPTMYPLKNSVTKKKWTRSWGTSKISHAVACSESLPSSAVPHNLKWDSGPLLQTPWNLTLPFSSQSRLVCNGSSPGAGCIGCPLSIPPPGPHPQKWKQSRSGNLTLPSSSTRLHKYFWKIMTQGMAISLRSQITC